MICFKLPVLAFCCFQFIVLTWEKTAVEQRVSVGVYCSAAAIHDGHADGHWSMIMPMVMVTVLFMMVMLTADGYASAKCKNSILI